MYLSLWALSDVLPHLPLPCPQSSFRGVSALNEKVNVLDFFTNHIIPELQDGNPSNLPVSSHLQKRNPENEIREW
jgi:hypothetical protein